MTAQLLHPIMRPRGPNPKQRKPQKCRTYQCQNTTEHDNLIQGFCPPCHKFITAGIGRDNQLYRNALRNLKEILTRNPAKTKTVHTHGI